MRWVIPRVIIFLVFSQQGFAWGPDGHHTVATFAYKLLQGTAAKQQVDSLLGNISDAAVWADCAKGVDPTKDFKYQNPGCYHECAVFETPQLEASMEDFVPRNTTNCNPKPGEEFFHKQYHYADINFPNPHIKRAWSALCI